MSTETGESTIWGALSCGLAFQGTNVGPKQLVSDEHISWHDGAVRETTCLQDLDEILVRWVPNHDLQLPSPDSLEIIVIREGFLVVLDCVHCEDMPLSLLALWTSCVQVMKSTFRLLECKLLP